MTNLVATKIKEIREGLVDVLLASDEINDWCGGDSTAVPRVDGRVRNSDRYAVNLGQYPLVTVQIYNKKTEDGGAALVKHIPRFKIRAYSNQIDIENANDEQIDLGETITQVLLEDYRIGGICENSDVIDTNYILMESMNTRGVFIQCVEVTVDCWIVLPRQY